MYLWVRGVVMGAHKWPNVRIWIELEPLGVTPAQITAIMIKPDLLLIFWSISCCAVSPFPSSLFLLHSPQKKANPEQNCVALSFSGGDGGKHKQRRNSSFSTYQRRRRATWEFFCLTWWSEKLPTEQISFCTEQKVCAITRNSTIFVSWCDDDTKSPRPSLWVGMYSHKNSLHTYVTERSCYWWLNKRSASCKTAFITI